MSVLTHVIRRRQVWSRLSEISEQRRKQRATFDWIFYLMVIGLVFVYRNEIMGCLSKYLDGLF